MPNRKLSQIRAMILVVALELEKIEVTMASKKKREKRPPHVELKLIRGGKG